MTRCPCSVYGPGGRAGEGAVADPAHRAGDAVRIGDLWKFVSGSDRTVHDKQHPNQSRNRSPAAELRPLLYLHGMSSGDFVPALGQFLGSSSGLSPAVITRLTEAWKAEQKDFAARGHQQAQLVLFQPDVHVDAISPHIDVVHAGQAPQGIRRPRRRLRESDP
jgi:hypothetical protein